MKEILKGALGLVAGFGIGAMMKTGVNILTPENAGKITKWGCKLGGFLLASYAGRIACKELDKIDEDFTKTKEMITNMAAGAVTTVEDAKEDEDNED